MTDDAASTTALIRDHERVADEYGAQKWPAVEQLIENWSDGEAPGRATLARVHRRVVRDYAYPGDPREQREGVLGGERRKLAVGAGVAAAERLISDAVVDACTPQTDLVIELGCGWGWHVLGAWLAGGPRDALYVGAEFTAAGCRAAAQLAALDSGLHFVAHEFDYHDPASLQELGSFAEAVVFSVHSIEQIPRLHRQIPRAIAGLADRVRCLHFEPVGWQVTPDSVGSSRAYAERHDYTRDLIDVLRADEQAGVLEIDGIEVDLIGLNPDNSTTLVRWRAGAR